jgi:hypothetical protein
LIENSCLVIRNKYDLIATGGLTLIEHSMTDYNQIKRFVQETLGCGCPEEVFRSIQYRWNAKLNNFVTIQSAMIIGNRLLIYVTEAGNAGCGQRRRRYVLSQV